MAEKTIMFVSHTHWDREWYQPFEEFRIRLVQMVDKLLDILDHNPDYLYFMLDGQTIVLDDYLAIRPENKEKLMNYISEGRILVGPWYILPDEFLASPESMIRNLLFGLEGAEAFGGRMKVGYIPDPFGHISQLPQILRGFDIDSAVFMRGVGTAPNEFTWVSPDGSEVLVLHQQNSYGNASHMPKDKGMFIGRTRYIKESLMPTASTDYLLAMNGTDHEEPMEGLPVMLDAVREALEDTNVIHGTLPQFISAVRDAAPVLEKRYGEMRDSSRFPLLPGVLSTRMWIKQRNAVCETLLSRWAEPLAAITEILDAPLTLKNQAPLVKQAWRYLVQNHPHDSICGCSIDQVHDEMKIRFDWVDQIGETVVRQGLEALGRMIHTDNSGSAPAVIVFNPTTVTRDDLVTVKIPVPFQEENILLTTKEGQTVVPAVLDCSQDILFQSKLGVDELRMAMGMIAGGDIQGKTIQGFDVNKEESHLSISLQVAEGMPANKEVVQKALAEVSSILDDGNIDVIHACIHSGRLITCRFIARDVPGLGYRTYFVQPVRENLEDKGDPVSQDTIENDFFHIKAEKDGTLTITDKLSGTVFEGSNRFIDMGDRGDEYNFCPVEKDTVIHQSTNVPQCKVTAESSICKTMEITMNYRIPAALKGSRSERDENFVDMPIVTRISLIPEGKRIDIETTVINHGEDHRLRVHFPIPADLSHFDTEGHFDIIHRSIDLPSDTAGWVEQPAPTHPQSTWTDAGNGTIGLMVGNRGLPEVEVMKTDKGSEIALTLLRSVGWLSRGDMSVRKGHAGPGLPTPEAQCKGKHTFYYTLIPHQGGWNTVFHQAHAFNAPLRAVAVPSHEGTLPLSGRFLTVASQDFIVSAVKKAEKGNAYIIRLWNTREEACQSKIKLEIPFRKAAYCNLMETEMDSLDVDDEGFLTISAKPREIVSLMLKR